MKKIFQCDIVIDAVTSQEEFFVVPDTCCSANVLIGNTFIKSPYFFVKAVNEINFCVDGNMTSVNHVQIRIPESNQVSLAAKIVHYEEIRQICKYPRES